MESVYFLRNGFFNIISTLCLLTSPLVSSEELTNVRVLGGFSTECSKTNPDISPALQPIIFNVLSSQKTGSVLNAEFEVQFVECVKGQWTKLKTANLEIENNITDELNQNMKEKQTFNKWRVHVQNPEGKILHKIPVTIGSNAKFKFKIKVNSLDVQKNSEAKSKFVDVILIADRIKKTSADYFFDEVNWGRVRITLD